MTCCSCPAGALDPERARLLADALRQYADAAELVADHLDHRNRGPDRSTDPPLIRTVHFGHRGPDTKEAL